MWLFLFIMNLLIPLVMIGFGLAFMLKPPTEISEYYGYRTPRSMSSEAAWDFAHRYFGRLWLIFGLVLLPLTVVGMLLLIGVSEAVLDCLSIVFCLIQCVVMLIPMIPTELALKKHFGN